MSDSNQNLGMPDSIKPAIPSGLNILTILTFIGCALGFLSGIWNFFNAKSGLDKMEEAINSGKVDEMPSYLKKFFSPEMLEMTRKAYENRLPIFLITMVATALCLVGAIQMRKLKTQGYYIYVIGELLPFVSSIVFIGMAAFSGWIMGIAIGFTLLFIILYTVQRKHLVN